MGVRLIDDVQFTIGGNMESGVFRLLIMKQEWLLKKAWDSQKIRRRNFSISEDIVGKF